MLMMWKEAKNFRLRKRSQSEAEPKRHAGMLDALTEQL
jgi:hypothetical protein